MGGVIKSATFIINVSAVILGLRIVSFIFPHSSYGTTSLSGQDKVRSSRESKSAIVTLSANLKNEKEDLCLALTSVSNLLERQNKTLTPVIVFHDTDVSSTDKDFLIKCTSQLVAFVELDFHDHPKDYDIKKEFVSDSSIREAQINRFWNYLLWKRPELKSYETIMKIDKYSCFSDEVDLKYWFNNHYKYLPNLEYGQIYLSGVYWNSKSNQDVISLYNFAKSYIETNDIQPSNTKLWNKINKEWNNNSQTLQSPRHFEISNALFFKRRDVSKWNEAVSEKEPFGLYRFGWDYSQVRVITLAMFAKENEIKQKELVGYEHKKCTN